MLLHQRMKEIHRQKAKERSEGKGRKLLFVSFPLFHFLHQREEPLCDSSSHGVDEETFVFRDSVFNVNQNLKFTIHWHGEWDGCWVNG